METENDIDLGEKIGYCDVCEYPMYANSAHCLHCGEVPCYLICEECWGTGEVKDEHKIRSWSIDIPYKTCPSCHGERKKALV